MNLGKSCSGIVDVWVILSEYESARDVRRNSLFFSQRVKILFLHAFCSLQLFQLSMARTKQTELVPIVLPNPANPDVNRLPEEQAVVPIIDAGLECYIFVCMFACFCFDLAEIYDWGLFLASRISNVILQAGKYEQRCIFIAWCFCCVFC